MTVQLQVCTTSVWVHSMGCPVFCTCSAKAVVLITDRFFVFLKSLFQSPSCLFEGNYHMGYGKLHLIASLWAWGLLGRLTCFQHDDKMSPSRTTSFSYNRTFDRVVNVCENGHGAHGCPFSCTLMTEQQNQRIVTSKLGIVG